MRYSIERPVAYLDHRVIEFANRLPERFKIQGLTEKAVLRRALAGLLPDEILHRTKQPNRAPDSASFCVDGEPLDYFDDLLSEDSIRHAGFFDPGAVGKRLDKRHARKATGFADNQAFVGILSTMLLHRGRVDRSA